MLRGPGREVTYGWDGWVVWRARARNWVEMSDRWSFTGRVLVSVCRCGMGDILRQPVAMRRAEFWMVWSLLMFEGDVLGNQMGAA